MLVPPAGRDGQAGGHLQAGATRKVSGSCLGGRARTHGLQLVIVVQLAGRVGLDGGHVEAGPECDHQEQRNGLGRLAREASQVDPVKFYVPDVVQLVQPPEGLPRLRACLSEGLRAGGAAAV